MKASLEAEGEMLVRDDPTRRLFKALADKTRFDIVQDLGQRGEQSVTSLCLTLGATQPLMSWHVRVLRTAGVVRTRRIGRHVFCSLDHKTIASQLQRFDLLMEGRLPIVEGTLGPTLANDLSLTSRGPI